MSASAVHFVQSNSPADRSDRGRNVMQVDQTKREDAKSGERGCDFFQGPSHLPELNTATKG